MLSEVDKWSQKYTWYRKLTVMSLVILVISIVVFFLNLSSLMMSTICLMMSFISVLVTRIGLSKMDEFKSLYVNTVPMIDPERDFKESQTLNENQDELEVELSEIEEMFVESFDLTETTTMDELQSLETQEQEDLEEVKILEEDDEETSLENSLVDESNVFEIKTEEEALPVDSKDATADETTEIASDEELSLEGQVFQVIENILTKNQCQVDVLSFKTVSNYLTIYVKNRVFMRIKLTGRKQYVLTYLSQAEVEALGLTYEEPSKSEAYTSRVKFTSIEVLAPLENQIVEMYKRFEK
ncbi:hypothetical protein [Turicibacter sp. TJ11]|uniref:hypothetical protein n=1 Tax=Turicibacter sp. TJ11 TaxID=2806443 RepID=UPI001F2CA471|nr:hypothetical protein [Turicibacter sp. TJ11]